MSIPKVLRLDDCRVKQAMSHEALKGKKPIARGVFSAVFEGSKPSTVYKLTADSFGYWMLNCGWSRVKHRHFPKTFADFGEVGEIKLNGKEFPLYLFEMERLQKLEHGGEAKRLATLIAIQQDVSLTNAWRWPQAERAVFSIQDMMRAKTLPKHVRNALVQLEEFCCNYPGSALDMHMGNFMQRKSGELVITDPLADKAVINALHKSLGRRAYA